MSEQLFDRPLPRGVLLASGALVATTLLFAALGHSTGIGRVADKPGAAAAEREFRIFDRAAGGMEVFDARSGHLILVMPTGEGGFVRATMRALAQERRQVGLGPETPFRLARTADGRLALEDPAVQRRIDLDAFGPSNSGQFKPILDAPK
jgi:putative photosynthetic complex assembly protein